MNSQKTKKKLTGSVIALIVCFAMLLGTTFAWFTDTASTSVNTIQSGKLDVALEMQNADGAWVAVDEDEPLEFVKAKNADENEEILWEPGCTYNLPELRVVNKGNLALKYKVVISGIAGDAKLNEAIEWTMKVGEEKYSTEKEYSLNKKDDFKTFTISGHMKESAGNQYQGLSIDGIYITVYATQDTVEYDSTTNEYDKDATYAAMADVTKLTETNISVQVYNGSSLGSATDQALDTAYSFKTTEATASEDYKNYHAEFVVKADKNIDANDIMLAGWYASYCGDNGAWIGFKNPEYTAGDEIRLMQYMLSGGSVSYEELCEDIKEFKCGAVDLTGDNAGTTITVELRLYEVNEDADSLASVDAETGNYITVGTYSYTF